MERYHACMHPLVVKSIVLLTICLDGISLNAATSAWVSWLVGHLRITENSAARARISVHRESRQATRPHASFDPSPPPSLLLLAISLNTQGTEPPPPPPLLSRPETNVTPAKLQQQQQPSQQQPSQQQPTPSPPAGAARSKLRRFEDKAHRPEKRLQDGSQFPSWAVPSPRRFR